MRPCLGRESEEGVGPVAGLLNIHVPSSGKNEISYHRARFCEKDTIMYRHKISLWGFELVAQILYGNRAPEVVLESSAITVAYH